MGIELGGVQVRRGLTRLGRVVRQRGEGHLIAIHGVAVEDDERPISVGIGGDEIRQCVRHRVCVVRHIHRDIAGVHRFPLEPSRRDDYLVGIGNRTAQYGGRGGDSGRRQRLHGRIRHQGRVRREGVVSINREVTAAAVGLYTHGVGGLGDESGQRVSGRGHRHHRPGARRLRLVLQIPSRLTATCHPADEGSVIGDRTYGQAAGLVAGDRPHGKVGDNRARLRTGAEVVTPQEHQVRRTADVRREIRIGHHRIDMHCIATGEVELVGMIVVAGVQQIVGEVVGIHGIGGGGVGRFVRTVGGRVLLGNGCEEELDEVVLPLTAAQDVEADEDLLGRTHRQRLDGGDNRGGRDDILRGVHIVAGNVECRGGVSGADVPVVHAATVVDQPVVVGSIAEIGAIGQRDGLHLGGERHRRGTGVHTVVTE